MTPPSQLQVPGAPETDTAGLHGRTVYLDVLGCAKNLVDAEATLGLLQAAGMRRVAQPEDAEILLVNTCGFLASAREESVERILELVQFKGSGHARLVGVLGCLVSREPAALAEELPEVDVWLPAGAHGELPVRLARAWADLPATALRRATDRSGNGRAPVGAFAGFGSRVLLTPRHTAYLKISEGCSNTCTFCSIPLMRGTQRSRPLATLVEEARDLATRGVRELHLVAQDLTHYGFDLPQRTDLLELVAALSEVEGIAWIRLLYAHPGHLTPRMLQGLFEVPKVVPYLDIPIQHASDRILRAMQRPYRAATVRRQLTTLRQRYPDMTLRSTVIVGFPGETEDDFTTLCRFVDEIGFDRLGIFAYSREPGTPAGSLRGRPRRSTVERRMAVLESQQMHLAARRAAARVGQRTRLLVDAPLEAAYDPGTLLPDLARGTTHVGRTAGEALDVDGVVFVEAAPDRPLAPGDLVSVEIVAADVYDLRARVSAQAT